MKKIKLVYVSLLMISLASFSTTSVGDEMKRAWLTSTCYQLRLSVWDKMNLGSYLAKYMVTSSEGRVFVAEKNATEDSNSAEVIFPDDFRDPRTNLRAGINCTNQSYQWAIYADGVLIDKGSITFDRVGRTNSKTK